MAPIALVEFAFVNPHPLLQRVRYLAALPIVFASSVSIIFCATTTAASGLWSCQYDLAGRYATALMLVIPFFVATIFTAVVMLEPDIYTIGTEKAIEGGLTRIARGEVDATPPKDITSTSPRLSSLAMFGLRSQRSIL